MSRFSNNVMTPCLFLHYHITGTLEISAGVPWIHIVNATRLAGKRGSMARLTDESIRIETNVDVDESRILIRILEGPQHGIIRVNSFIFLPLSLSAPLFTMYPYTWTREKKKN